MITKLVKEIFVLYNDFAKLTSERTVSSELTGCFNIIFYQSAKDAVFKDLSAE